MRALGAVVLALLALSSVPRLAHAQFSPGSIIGGARNFLGHILPIPRYRNHYHRPAPRSAATQPTARDTTAQSDAQDAANVQPGIAGPAAWPTAYQDLVGFTLWPDDYAARVRDRGFDVIANAILPRRQRETTGSANAASSAEGCGAAVEANWPSERLQQANDTSAKSDDVSKLQASVSQSLQNIGAACKKASTAPDRLNNLISTLWAVRDGGAGIREPMRTLVADAKPANVTNDTTPASTPADQNRQQACAGMNIGASERMVREIEQRVRPNERQRPVLENLRKTSGDMAKMLMASCIQPVAATPLARLDAADDQLATLNYAALTVRIALNQLYASLDNGQKARLNATP